MSVRVQKDIRKDENWRATFVEFYIKESEAMYKVCSYFQRDLSQVEDN